VRSVADLSRHLVKDYDEVQTLLATGESFEQLARTWSMDESGDAGGRVPPVVRGRSPLALLAVFAFYRRKQREASNATTSLSRDEQARLDEILGTSNGDKKS